MNDRLMNGREQYSCTVTIYYLSAFYNALTLMHLYSLTLIYKELKSPRARERERKMEKELEMKGRTGSVKARNELEPQKRV